ncbi:MAG TPA: nucleotidyltransferase family protein [Candidatus Nanoarchaeia archaeon]|nr:hypothetical protein [uncultured archaeon]AQS29569.1 hypothetical protein [uncultured archaeon]HLD55036.1 nucleotidyltransferase family protein [Candidatus Nanoarchaeia archaeon]
MKTSIKSIKQKIIPILKKNKVIKAGIFGSYARGEQKKNSDIDILVKISKPMGFSFMTLQFELEKELNQKVDLITYKSLHPLIKKIILNEEIRIL